MYKHIIIKKTFTGLKIKEWTYVPLLSVKIININNKTTDVL